MKEVTLVAIDLAKEKFQLHGCDSQGAMVFRRQVKRDKLAENILALKPCRIAMESCGSSQYWGRKFRAQGHEVRLIAPKFVKPFLKSQKNDMHDAEAIAEAAQRPSMRYVGLKSLVQQDLQSLHKSRDLVIENRVGLANHVRGLLLEYGVVIPEGYRHFKKQIPMILEEGENGLTPFMRMIVAQIWEVIKTLDGVEEHYTEEIKGYAKEHPDCQRLMKIPGVGPMVATHFVSAIADPNVFKNGRECSAWLGLVPKQHSSGGVTKLGGITKQGDGDLRSLMYEGAASILNCARRYKRTDPWSVWALKLYEQKGYGKAVIALENKLCRTMWHILAKKEEFQMVH